jgi:hypothetical protein
MTRFSVAKDLVVMNLGSIVPELFGGGPKQSKALAGNRGWNVANPWRPGADLSEMKVWPGGAWKDFVSSDRGDAMDMIAHALFGHVSKDTRMQALEWAENRFGIRDMAPGKLEEIRRQGEESRAQLEVAAAADSHESREKARKAFYGGQQEVLGTPVDTYLREVRGLDLRAIPHLARRSFRYRPDCDYWPAREFGASLRDRSFPGLLSAMVDGRGQLGAVHYTLVEPDGSGKLDTLRRGWVDEKPDGRRKGKSAKLMYPATSGLEIRVSWGSSGMSCEDAAANGVVSWFGHTEGIEDALTIALSDPELRMHAAGSLSGFLSVPDHAAAEGHLLFRDNDWDKPQAVELFDQAHARFKSFGKPVQAVAMPVEWGKDANDVLNWKG